MTKMEIILILGFGPDFVVDLQIIDCLKKGCDLVFSLQRRLRQHLPNILPIYISPKRQKGFH